jgi:hypothetical protein
VWHQQVSTLAQTSGGLRVDERHDLEEPKGVAREWEANVVCEYEKGGSVDEDCSDNTYDGRERVYEERQSCMPTSQSRIGSKPNREKCGKRSDLYSVIVPRSIPMPFWLGCKVTGALVTHYKQQIIECQKRIIMHRDI